MANRTLKNPFSLKPVNPFGPHFGTVFGIFGSLFLSHFFDAFWKPQKAEHGPKREPTWSPKWLPKCSFWRPAECELDTLFAVFGAHRLPQGRSKKATKLRTGLGIPSEAYFCRFGTDLDLHLGVHLAPFWLILGVQFLSGFWNGFWVDYVGTAVPPRRQIGGKGASPLVRTLLARNLTRLAQS